MYVHGYLYIFYRQQIRRLKGSYSNRRVAKLAPCFIASFLSSKIVTRRSSCFYLEADDDRANPLPFINPPLRNASDGKERYKQVGTFPLVYGWLVDWLQRCFVELACIVGVAKTNRPTRTPQLEPFLNKLAHAHKEGPWVAVTGSPGRGPGGMQRELREVPVLLFSFRQSVSISFYAISLSSLSIFFFHQLLANDSWFMTVMCLTIFAGMLGEIRQFGLNSSSSSCRCVRKSAFYF